MASSDFFENRKPWSERKHRLLGKYLPPFSAKVASVTRSREIFVVDGFAGAAVYEDGSEGSPILTAKFSDVCRTWTKPVNLNLINIESDTKNEGIFESLERATERWVNQGTVRNIRSDFRNGLPVALEAIGPAPALFFVDPFGPTYVHFLDLRPMLKRPQITELIINFDLDGLRRILDAALSLNTTPKAAATNVKNISKVIGSDRWQTKIIGNRLSTEQAEAILLEEYIDNIAAYGYGVVAYPIREQLASNPKYYFIFVSRHEDGIALMNDFISEEEDLLYGGHVVSNLPLFSDEASLSNAIAKRRGTLKAYLEKYLEEKKQLTRKRIRLDGIRANFGVYHSKDYNAVIKEFLDENRLRTESGKKRINDDDRLWCMNQE
jgi:three-Cys-motif partner protein